MERKLCSIFDLHTGTKNVRQLKEEEEEEDEALYSCTLKSMYTITIWMCICAVYTALKVEEQNDTDSSFLPFNPNCYTDLQCDMFIVCQYLSPRAVYLSLFFKPNYFYFSEIHCV